MTFDELARRLELSPTRTLGSGASEQDILAAMARLGVKLNGGYRERTEMHPALPPYLVPLMNDGGGNLYCLDSRREGEPPVVLWNHEAGESQEPERVAADFLSWMAERVERPDEG